MRRFLTLSVIAPLALAMGGCAGGSESSYEEEDEPRVGADAGGGDADGSSPGEADADAGPGEDADPGDAGDGDPDADAGDGDEDPDPDAGDGDAGDDDAGDGDAGPDPSDPCATDECYIGATCIEAGQPNAADSCEACLPTVARTSWSSDANSPACDGKPYWHGVTQALPTTPYGRKTAVSCHNCYVLGSSNADSLTKTLAMVNDGRGKVADLIELDIKEEGGVVYVEHDDNNGGTKGALFAETIADPTLKASSKILFIESKETTTSEAYVRKVLEALKANGYATAGRPVVLRAFDGVSGNLSVARKLLATADFIAMRPHFRLQVLFSRGDGNDIASLQTRIKGAKDKGYHGVEFEYQTPNLFSAIKYAESMDLGTNVWTIPVGVGEVFVTTLRDEVDALTVDYPVDKARALISDNNGLVYLNTWKQSGSSVQWFRHHLLSNSMPLGAADRPSLVTSPLGGTLFGGALAFDATKAQHMPLYDADNQPTDGYLVSTVVTFDQPIVPAGETSVLLGKADSASFSLELFRKSGGSEADAVLRFGVFVGDEYRYATYPANKLQSGPSYIVTGAYDGDGSVWIWVNNSSADSTTAGPVKGGVKQNDSPIVIGADPQGPTSTRFYFSGKVQMVLVQNWTDH